MSIWYGEKRAIQDVSIDIASNAVTAIIGPSGCGKSTFLRALNRMHELTPRTRMEDRKSTRLNSSHLGISYAVFCLKKKNIRHAYASAAEDRHPKRTPAQVSGTTFRVPSATLAHADGAVKKPHGRKELPVPAAQAGP